MINIVLADDHTLVRTGIKGLLENIHDFNVVAEACSGEQAVQVAREHQPDVVLLDNMACDILRTAVARRDAARSATTLEASGGVNLQTIRAIAETGVERISVGALTHQAVSLDIGLDWSTS